MAPAGKSEDVPQGKVAPGPVDGPADIPGRREDFQLLGGNAVKNRAVICFPVLMAGNSLNASVLSKVPGPH